MNLFNKILSIFSKTNMDSVLEEDSERIIKDIEIEDRNIERYQIQSGKLYNLWHSKNYVATESYGLKIIGHGNWLPGVFETMAKLYRRQKRYNSEIDILEAGIQAQKEHSNSGVAIRDFQLRIERIHELQPNSNNID
ncbi:hypothetical protein FIV11_14175 [Lactiplantibacillus plantarum]|uniref:hypothetical protein n=1 Tax=Lactiplantibacillus plantarum TaxID=1590 RepID=UPI00264D0DDC|nr:hypothetical protein [Lactiplantibacillus plantarum]MDN7062855.1 hypothetical protein [Lactiplantibacillus plantarum]